MQQAGEIILPLLTANLGLDNKLLLGAIKVRLMKTVQRPQWLHFHMLSYRQRESFERILQYQEVSIGNVW